MATTTLPLCRSERLLFSDAEKTEAFIFWSLPQLDPPLRHLYNDVKQKSCILQYRVLAIQMWIIPDLKKKKPFKKHLTKTKKTEIQANKFTLASGDDFKVWDHALGVGK